MEKKTINLDKIIDNMPFACSQYRSKIRLELITFARQLLELAAENAECEDGAIIDYGDEVMSASVNKQSILNTINEVEL